MENTASKEFLNSLYWYGLTKSEIKDILTEIKSFDADDLLNSLEDFPEDGNIFELDGKIHVDESGALSYLLRDEVLFANEFEIWRDEVNYGKCTVLFLNTSDTFHYACSEAENMPYKDIGQLYRLCLKYGSYYGKIYYACVLNNTQPLPSIKKDMQKLGIWNDCLEMLELNYMERE